MVKNFRVGEVFSDSFGILFRNFFPFLFISALVWLPAIAYQFYLATYDYESMPFAALPWYVEHAELVDSLMGFFLGPIATGAISYGVFQQLRGKRASVGDCIATGFARMFPVIAVSIATGLLFVLGFLLLVIPGIIFMCMYFVAVPCAVVEGRGLSALGRSRALTMGYRWQVFLLFLLFILVGVGLGLVIGFVVVSFENSLLAVGVTLLLQIVMSSWQATAQCVSYYFLRSMKESVELEDIASVFD